MRIGSEQRVRFLAWRRRYFGRFRWLRSTAEHATDVIKAYEAGYRAGLKQGRKEK